MHKYKEAGETRTGLTQSLGEVGGSMEFDWGLSRRKWG